MNIFKQERTLKVGTVCLEDDAERKVTRNLELTYSESFPDKLTLYFLCNDPSVEGYMNNYSIEEVEKLKKFITQVYNLMKEVPNDEDS